MLWQITLAIVILSTFYSNAIEKSENIFFIVHNPNGLVFNNSFNNENFDEYGCSGTKEISFILPGWKEKCNTTEWIPEMIENLQIYRGGCVICLDYYYYSKWDYGFLVSHFTDIAKVFFNKYIQWQNYGFEPENVFFFGFSFGAHLALEAGRSVNQLHNGSYLINRIDACEMAGPGFHIIPDSKLAAVNVQCIHTSGNYGTSHRNCHQNWNMGNCGLSQIAAGPYPKGSHGLCPYFYNSAFNNSFYAIPKPSHCGAKNEIDSWPIGFKMGYNENRFENVTGELFAETVQNPPYNKIDLDNEIL